MPSWIDLEAIDLEALDQLLLSKAPTLRGWVVDQSARTGGQKGRQAAEAYLEQRIGGLEAQLTQILALLTEDETDGGDNPLIEILERLEALERRVYALERR